MKQSSPLPLMMCLTLLLLNPLQGIADREAPSLETWSGGGLTAVASLRRAAAALLRQAGRGRPFAQEAPAFPEGTEAEAALAKGAPAPEPAADRRFDSGQPMVALTFDDGPGPYTEKILSLLQRNDSRATFFMVGNRLENFSETVRAVHEQGSEIGVHTWSHRNLTRLQENGIISQIKRTKDRVAQICRDAEIRFMRPPFGAYNRVVRKASAGLDMAVALWSVDTQDWRGVGAAGIYRAVMENVTNGSIILCHDLYAETAAAMERVIPELRRRGYQLVTLSELFADHEDGGASPGVVYNRLDPSRLVHAREVS